jgi:NitT/TauT family transport system substrate-binding protein
MPRPRLDRRAFLLGATGTMLAAPYVARAATVDLKVSLSAPYDGSTSPFFLGIQRKYYEEVGLRCQFDTSGGAVESIGRVGSGAYDFAVGDINVLMDFDARNADKAPSAIYMLYYRSPLSLITFAKSGITKPADIVGKTLGAAVTDGAYRLFPAYCKQAGIDPNSVKWKFVDLRLREALLLRGDVDGILGFDSTSYFNLLKGGAKPADVKFLYYSDSGMPLYGNCLIGAKKHIDTDPDLTKRFLAATGRSWQAAMADPDAAIAALRQQEGLIDVALETERLKWVIKNQLISEESRANGMGIVQPDRLAKSIALVKDGFALPTAPEQSLVFNPSFLPSADIRKVPV